MEVGLSRHNKRKARELPVWLEEYGSWLLIAAIVIVLSLGAILVTFFAAPPPPPPSAQLVISYGPVKVWGEGSGTRLSSVSVKVRNVASIQAEGVAIALAIPGRSFPLAGPTVLAAGVEGEFSSSINVTLAPTDQASIVMQCGNCAR
jgi:hypothetical protein